VRRGATGAAIALASAALALAGLAAPVRAYPPPPADMRVEGGEERWHPSRRFRILWQNPPSGTSPPIAAVHYRLRDPDGTTAIGPVRIGWPASSLEGLEVPAQPGAYTLEAWLEDAAGQTGAAATAKLRFDDMRPGNVEPVAPPAWIGRSSFPLTIRLGRPAGPAPVSGIRGYAVSVAPPPGQHPCQAGDRCSDAETDLRGGIGDDAYRIADLPQGTSQVRAVAVSGAGMASALSGSAVLRVDEVSPVVRLFGVPDGWVNHSVPLRATASDEASGMAPAAGGVAPFTAIAIDGAAPTVMLGAVANTTVIGEGVHRVAYYARDLAGNVDDGGESNGVANPAPPKVLVRIDRRPPSVSFANSQSPLQPELIKARVADSMSGPGSRPGWIGVRRAGSGDRFAPLPSAPTRTGNEVRALWDSDSYPAGDYQFRAVAYDAAGNTTATLLRADGKPMRLRSPLKAKTVLQAGFAGNGGAERRVPYGRSTSLEGSLTTAAGTPLGGQQLKIVERQPTREGATAKVSTVTTGPGGAFAVPLRPGPSRELVASFAGTPSLTRSTSRVLKLLVRSAISLRASAPVARVGGAPILFRGRVFADPGSIPAEGKSVQLQFRLPGLRWSEFRTVQTDRRGRFRYAYRFSDDDSRGAVFRFRAYAPAQAGWPFEPGGSRPVTVRGR
jgi:hypothetical protein